MKKQDYFNKRLEGMLKGDIKRSKAAQIRLKRGYKKAFQLIEDDIAKYVARLSGDLNLDIKSLKRKMTKDEIYALASVLGNEEAVMARYENLSYAEAIRLEMVKNLKEMAKENESLIFENLFKTYEHNYYSTSYLLYRTMDDFSFTKRVTKEYFDWIAKKPWTSDGKTFSDRIWKDQGKLVDELYKEFTVAATRGANFKEASKRMSRKMNVSYKKCLRLLNTEDSFFSNRAVMDAYKKSTADEYMILATLDRRTCEICGSQDTNHYKIKDAKIGINMPPFHPNCRCTTTVYFEDDDLPGERMMRDDKGKSVKTDYMSYDEWKKKYVDKADDNGYNINDKVEKDYRSLSEKDISRLQEISNEVYSSFSAEEKVALSEYTQGGYLDINSDLANGIDNYYEKYINNAIDKFQMDQDIITYRGTKEKYYQDYKVGDIFEGKVLYSTSVNYEQAKAFADDITMYDDYGNKGVVLEIRVPKKTRCLYIGENTNYAPGGIVSNEYELLLSNRNQYKVIEFENDKIVLEVVIDEN